MKPNPSILTTTFALLTGAAFAAEPAKNDAPAADGSHTSSSATVVTSGSGGKATVTIDVNGKRETREIDLGNGTEIKVTTGDGGVGLFSGGAAATVGEGKSVTWLGVAPEEVSEELRAQLPLEPGSGLVVRSVLPDSPADKAGLQKNDVLTKIDDQLLTNPGQLRALVGGKKDGDTVKLTLFRSGRQETLDVKLGTHRENPAEFLLSRFSNLGPLFQMQKKAVVVDKDGQVLGGGMELDATIEKITKGLRDIGVDEKSIAEAARALTETSKVIREAISDASTARKEVEKGSGDIAKALEEVRDAIEKVRKQTEDAVRKGREERRAAGQSLEKER